MKKDLFTHFGFFVALSLLIAVYKEWFSLTYLPFLYGGIIGTILPDIDYLVHAYFLKPQEETSRKVTALISDGKYKETWDEIVTGRRERTDLVFHSAYFQLIFLVFAFFVVSSSGSLLGRGVVLAFLLHILVDQVVDLAETKNLDSWFSKTLVISDQEQRKWYLIANIVALLVLGFIF